MKIVLPENYEKIASKQIEDTDGFLTDYTMYYDSRNGHYIFVYGDEELYTPENSDPDWEQDSREEAEDWFRNFGESLKNPYKRILNEVSHPMQASGYSNYTGTKSAGKNFQDAGKGLVRSFLHTKPVYMDNLQDMATKGKSELSGTTAVNIRDTFIKIVQACVIAKIKSQLNYNLTHLPKLTEDSENKNPGHNQRQVYDSFGDGKEFQTTVDLISKQVKYQSITKKIEGSENTNNKPSGSVDYGVIDPEKQEYAKIADNENSVYDEFDKSFSSDNTEKQMASLSNPNSKKAEDQPTELLVYEVSIPNDQVVQKIDLKNLESMVKKPSTRQKLIQLQGENSETEPEEKQAVAIALDSEKLFNKTIGKDLIEPDGTVKLSSLNIKDQVFTNGIKTLVKDKLITQLQSDVAVRGMENTSNGLIHDDTIYNKSSDIKYTSSTTNQVKFLFSSEEGIQVYIPLPGLRGNPKNSSEEEKKNKIYNIYKSMENSVQPSKLQDNASKVQKQAEETQKSV